MIANNRDLVWLINKALLHLEVSVKGDTKPGFLIILGKAITMHSVCPFLTFQKESASS